MAYAAVNGLNVYYEVHGTGPPLLLLHGGLGSIPEKWIPDLSPRFQAIAMEQMGHGRTAERMRWKTHDRSLDRLQALGVELERTHPGAAASLREGIEETLTLTRLGITGALKRTLASTNPCESMIECVRRTSRNVKHWRSGEMCLRWTAAGMLEAERQFRRIIGYRVSPSSLAPPSASSTVTRSRRSPSRSLEKVSPVSCPFLTGTEAQAGVN